MSEDVRVSFQTETCGQALRRALAKNDDQAAEIAELRRIISRCVDAIGNGAMALPECSLGFLGEVPDEIRQHCANVRKRITEQAAEIERLRGLVRAAHDHMHELTAIIPGNDVAYELTTRMMTSLRAAISNGGGDD